MKIGTIANPLFELTLEKVSAEQLPLKVAYKLRQIVKVVREQKATHDELRNKALEKYGDKNEDGSIKTDDHGNVQFSDDNYKNYVKELTELYAVEFDIPAKVKFDELGDLKLSTQELGSIEELLDPS